MTYRSAFGDSECLAHGCSIMIMVVGTVQLSNQARRCYCEPQQRPKEKERQRAHPSESSNPPRSMLVCFSQQNTDHSEYPYTDHYVCVARVQAKNAMQKSTTYTQHPSLTVSSLLHGAGLLVYDPHTTQHKPVK